MLIFIRLVLLIKLLSKKQLKTIVNDGLRKIPSLSLLF